jgi:pimeloyl-ACP methyl ester carboxylesterase
MSTFILIHGAWHGGWCWYKVIPLLEKEGHTVLAPDLPGHGRDKTPVLAVSLQLYVDRVCQLLDAQRKPVLRLMIFGMMHAKPGDGIMVFGEHCALS